MPRYLLVCGCARSGTTALARLLNQHPRIALGMERYINYVRVGGPIGEAIFTPERFLDIRKGDTFYEEFSFFEGYDDIDQKYRQAEIVGDKVPKYYLHYDDILKNLPGAQILYIVRNIYDVAASYKVRASKGFLWPKWRTTLAAIEDWNLSLRETHRRLGKGRIHVVPYERFLLEGKGLDELSDFLRMDVSGLAGSLNAGEPQKSGPKILDASDAYAIATRADFELYRKVLGWRRDPRA